VNLFQKPRSSAAHGTEQLLLALDSQNGDVETEPVKVWASGSRLVLELWDGRRLSFDRNELRAALERAEREGERWAA
jgi:hypothetical protein